MKKIYIIAFIAVLIIFIYYGVGILNDSLPKVAYTFNYFLSSSNDSGESLFKSTPENKELVTAMLNIHKDFTNEPPIEHIKIENDINNFYKIQKLFPSFNSYYLAKIKITNAIYNELDKLENDTKNLSEEELNTFFINNAKYLDKNWGITDSSELIHLVNTIKLKSGKKVISCELEESYFYMPDINTTNFRIVVDLEDNSKLYIGVLASFSETTTFQKSPVIRFYGTQGGIS